MVAEHAHQVLARALESVRDVGPEIGGTGEGHELARLVGGIDEGGGGALEEGARVGNEARCVVEEAVDGVDVGEPLVDAGSDLVCRGADDGVDNAAGLGLALGLAARGGGGEGCEAQDSCGGEGLHGGGEMRWLD